MAKRRLRCAARYRWPLAAAALATLTVVPLAAMGRAPLRTVPGPGAALGMAVQATGDGAQVTLQLDQSQQAAVLDALGDGLRSAVTFQVRLYQERRGLRGLLGNQLVAEVTRTHTARHDPYADRFVIEVDSRQGGGQPRQAIVELDDGMQLLAALGHAELALQVPAAQLDGRPLTLAVRARLQPVRLVAPLHVIALFGDRGSIVSGWHELPLAAPRGGA